MNRSADEIRQPLEDFEAIRRADGTWLHAPSRLPLPGARDFTAGEYLGAKAGFHPEAGDWVEVPWDVANLRPEILDWCRLHANSDLGATGFRFERNVFEEAAAQAIPIVYFPEIDDPRVYVQQLARSERKLRVAKQELEGLERQRAQRLKVAAENGLSRRKLAALVGMSFARVQQLIAREERTANG